MLGKLSMHHIVQFLWKKCSESKFLPWLFLLKSGLWVSGFSIFPIRLGSLISSCERIKHTLGKRKCAMVFYYQERLFGIIIKSEHWIRLCQGLPFHLSRPAYLQLPLSSFSSSLESTFEGFSNTLGHSYLPRCSFFSLQPLTNAGRWPTQLPFP